MIFVTVLLRALLGKNSITKCKASYKTRKLQHTFKDIYT